MTCPPLPPSAPVAPSIPVPLTAWGRWLRASSLTADFGADFAAIRAHDPAARSALEVLCCYPGLHAISAHRLAHRLHQRGARWLPRLIAAMARWLTGIEIHPAAHLGRGLFIDHGMGVVIGETARIGDGTVLYQGVTLGGTGSTDRRHPTVGRDVVLGSGATVLGPVHIGDGARIGAGSVVLGDVPAHCTAVGVPHRLVGRPADGRAAALAALHARVTTLEMDLAAVQAADSLGRGPKAHAQTVARAVRDGGWS